MVNPFPLSRERAGGRANARHNPMEPFRNERVGLIDAHFLRDHDGRQYLYWKADGNDLRPRRATPIFVQELDHEGLGLIGQAREVLTNDLLPGKIPE